MKMVQPYFQHPCTTLGTKLVSLLAGLFLLSSAFAATTTVLYEGFEGNFPGDNGWEVGDYLHTSWDAYWGRVNTDFGGEGAHSGSWKGYCAGVGYAGTASAPTYHSDMRASMDKIVDLTGYTAATLTFWYKMPSLGCCEDYAYVMMGEDWLWNCGMPASEWTKVTLDLTPYIGQSRYISFHFNSDSSAVGEGMYLDDITITASTGSVPPLLTTPEEQETLSHFGTGLYWMDQGDQYSWYRVYAMTATGQKVLDTWTTNCSYTPSSVWPAGSYTWYVQGWSSAGLGPWSEASHFTLTTEPPSQPIISAPVSGSSIAAPGVGYSWFVSNYVAWCELLVYKDGKPFLDKWYPTDGRKFNTCTNLIRSHTPGNYKWWVRSWNSDGMGPWSSANEFTINNYDAPGYVNADLPWHTVSAAAAMHMTYSGDPLVDWFNIEINRDGTNCVNEWCQGNGFHHLSNPLPLGSYSWRIRGWNSAGTGPWSSPIDFEVFSAGKPAEPGQGNSYSVSEYNPSRYYLWYGGESDITWYELYIMRNNSLFYDQWFPTSQLTSLDRGFVQATNIPSHSAGTYKWWVRYYSTSTGMSPWSGSETFTLTSP